MDTCGELTIQKSGQSGSGPHKACSLRIRLKCEAAEVEMVTTCMLDESDLRKFVQCREAGKMGPFHYDPAEDTYQASLSICCLQFLH